MLKLRNVKKDGNKIVADCYPENEKFFAHVSLLGDDLSTFTGSFDGHEGEYIGYLAHARKALLDMVNGDRVIADCELMWY